MVLKIDCYTMLNGLKKSHFDHNFQKIMIMKEFQKKIGEIYLGGGKIISTDMFFILENIRINCHMDASEFEGLLYNMLSEERFANPGLDMTDENDDYTISDYVSQHFGITIGETMTCLTCHATKYPNIFIDFSCILPLEEMSQREKMRSTSHEKMTNLGKSCVTMTDLMDKFYETAELSDVI